MKNLIVRKFNIIHFITFMTLLTNIYSALKLCFVCVDVYACGRPCEVTAMDIMFVISSMFYQLLAQGCIEHMGAVYSRVGPAHTQHIMLYMGVQV